MQPLRFLPSSSLCVRVDAADPADTLWMVFKFEAMRPLSLMLQQIDLPEEPSGLQSMFMSKWVQGCSSQLNGWVAGLMHACRCMHFMHACMARLLPAANATHLQGTDLCQVRSSDMWRNPPPVLAGVVQCRSLL